MSETIKLSSRATDEFWEIPVLFEDAHLLALDKPAGLLTSPDRADPQRPNLISLLHAGIAAGKPWAKERGVSYLSNAVRMNVATSGVLLFARSKPVLVALANSFSSEKTLKKYVALVQGTPREERFEVNAKIAAHPASAGLMHIDARRGKQARTNFEVAERFRGYALIHCWPLMERAQQIRVHLRHCGLPLVGDALYGGKPLWLSRLKTNYRLKEGRTERPLISRAALHAEQLTLPHPVSSETITINAPWPKDLKVVLKYLREFSK